MSHFFHQLYHFIANNKLKAIGAFLIVFLGLLFISFQLKFEEDISQLVPENEEAITLNKVLKQVDFADKIVVLLTKEKEGNINDLISFASKISDSLQHNYPKYVTEVQGIIADDDFEQTMDFVYEHIPLFLNPTDYQKISSKITTEAITSSIVDNYKKLISPSGFVTKEFILKDPLGISFLGLEKLKELQIGDNFTLKNGFIITKNEKHLLLFIKPKLPTNETDKNTLFVKQINGLKDKLNHDFLNKVTVQYYGSTVVAVANANQIKSDIQVTVTIAMTVLLIILILFYKKISIPIILFLPTLFGALLAIATLTLFRGTISAISLGIGSLLLGITLDFSLHILTHYRHNNNIETLYQDVSKPIVMSSITTALAFLCLLFIKSRALQDLGIFASVSVFGSSFFALILIPHLYQNKVAVVPKKNWIDTIASFPFEKSKVIISVCIVLFMVSLFTYNKVIFDKDISKMNYQTEDLLKTEKQLNKLINTHSKSLYIVAYGHNQNTVLQNNIAVYKHLVALKEQHKILNYSSVASVILSKEAQFKKITNWNNYWTNELQNGVKENIITSSSSLGFKSATFSRFYKMLSNDYKQVSLSDYEKVKALNASEFVAEKGGFYTVLSSLKVTPEKLNTVKSFFKSQNDILVIDRQAMNETFLNGFKDNFNMLLGYSFFAVVLVLMLFFKRIELVLITILPIALTWLVTLGLMGALGLSFNIFNIIISTFIFGLGIDYAIFMTNGLIKEYETGEKQLPTYRISIILSVITTVLGIGVLVLAKHPALQSISLVTLIGIFTALIVTFTIQPLVFRALITNRARKGLAPFTVRKTILAVISFTYYGVGGVILSICAVSFLKLMPLSKKVKYQWLHKRMSFLMKSVLLSNGWVKKEILNPNQEDFKKPCIMIVNHTSFLDTLAVGMITPNVIYLVNDWVYKSAVFGILAKAVGYYPVSNGIDDSFDHLQKKIDQGYSLVVFPEGRRMYSNKMGRFKKGAFLLAEKLNLDVLPIYIHGNSEVLPKGDFIIYDGAITVKIGDRILINNPDLGTSLKDKTKAISTLYKQNFEQIRKDLEDVNYFKKQILSNYVFKTEAIYKSVKADLNNNLERYYQLSNQLPLTANILHIADDYGQIDKQMIYNSNRRKIKTYISLEQKRTIAKTGMIGKEHDVEYIETLENIKSGDVLIISAPINLTLLPINNFKTIFVLNEVVTLKSKHTMVNQTIKGISIFKSEVL